MPTMGIPYGILDERYIKAGDIITLPNTGLHILDTNASHDLIIAPGSDLTADKTLTITTGDSDRTITLSGNPTLADWFDQSVKQASSPTFANLSVTTINALTPTAQTIGFTIAGGITSKTLTVPLDASVSGANTGDQTITLTSDVTGTGTGSFVTTIATNAVTFAKMQQVATGVLLGRNTALTGNIEAVTDIATAITIGGSYIYRSGGTDVAVVDGGTGTSTGSITPVGNYTITQNSVAVVTSEAASAVVNTLYLKAGNVGIGTTAPGTDLVGTWDYTATPLLQVDGATPRLIARGSTSGALDLIDTGAATNEKWMQLIADGGITYFRSITDTGGAQANNILVLNNNNGNVGIGTTGPLSKLDVNGGVAIGSYAGANAAPVNGLIVSGSVGIGLTNPTSYAKLTIQSTRTDTPGSADTDLEGTYGVWGIRTGTNNSFNIDQYYSEAFHNSLNITNGNVGIGTTSSTAKLHLPAGTATANTAPLKFTSGVSLTTAEAGAMEFTTDSLYFTITTGPTRKTVAFETGISGNFTTVDLKTVTVVNGLITAIS